MGSVHSVPSPPPPPPQREKSAPQNPAGQLAEQPTPAAPRAGGQPASLLELGASVGGISPAAPGPRGNRKRVRRIEQPGPFAWAEGRSPPTPKLTWDDRADTARAGAPVPARPGEPSKTRPMSPLEQGRDNLRKARQARLNQPGQTGQTTQTGTPAKPDTATAPTAPGKPNRPLSPLEQGLEAYRKSRQDMLDRSGGQRPAPGPLGTVPPRPDPSQKIPLGRMPAGGAPTPLGRMPQGGQGATGGTMRGIQRASLTDPGQGALGTPNRPTAPQGPQVAAAPAILKELLRRLGRSVPVPPPVPVPAPQPEANTQGNMDQAEPLEPLPPFPTDDGLNTTQFPGQDPDRARQDAIPEPESYPESDLIIPADTGHDGGIDGLPDMTILEIRPRTEADLNKPAVEVLGKGDRWLIPDFEKWLNSDERKAFEAYRKERQTEGDGPRNGTPPYGPIWDALKNPHRHKNHPSRQFIFSWDKRHGGEIEVRNKNGTSVGVLNPITGVWEKPKPSHPFHGKP